MIEMKKVCVFALCIGLAPAAASADQPCPYGSQQARELLDAVVRAARTFDSFRIPERISKAIQGDVRALDRPQDESICRRLNRRQARDYLYEYWDADQLGEERRYPRYEVGYFRSGDYFFVAVTQTPPPQPENLGRMRVVTGYDQLIVYDRKLEKIIGWAL